MSIQLKIVGIIASLILASVVFYLLRKKKLREGYSIFWGIIVVFTIIGALWYEGVIIITNIFDIESPVNGLFFAAFFILTILSLHFSVQFTQISKKIKTLAQENTILREKIKELEDKLEKFG